MFIHMTSLGYFAYDFVWQLAPSPPPPTNRVWIGGLGSIIDEYGEYFLIYFGYYWYTQYSDSQTAFNYGLTYAAPYIGSDVAFVYTQGLNPLYF
jgi:hypothetical protein